jgi:hypothetical protein
MNEQLEIINKKIRNIELTVNPFDRRIRIIPLYQKYNIGLGCTYHKFHILSINVELKIPL